ncbi:MAG: histidine--tRNA ligase [Candidatus Diapherotrites archaeon]|nr:histidine--tRNA ligase [Candidatus Diapherotrites archaeon]
MAFETVRGMRDLPPELARKKQKIEEICKQTFERYGFEPLDTPIVESLELLTKKGSAGEAIENEIYAFEDKGGRKLGLRFDLTVPLARFVASSRSLQIPFKRYQIGKVYRYDRPQAKRYREFTQADADIIGVSSVLAELELISLSYDIIKELRIEAKLALNSRKLLESIAIASGVKRDQLSDCFRIIDKVSKVGWDEIEKELCSKKIRPDILDIIKRNDLEYAKKVILSSEQCDNGLERLNDLLRYVKIIGLSDFVNVDLSLARGLDYYTDIVMEIKSLDGTSIGGGGRYDGLIEKYGGKSTYATGISFGIDRMLDTIFDKIISKETMVKAFVAVVRNEDFDEALKVVTKLRSMGMNAEFDLMHRNISKNLEYASRKGIPYFIIIGPKELSERKVKLRDMKTGKERYFNLSDIEKIKETL